MLATFNNRLKVEPVIQQENERVYYKHSFRCPVEVWFEKTDKNPYGWVLQFKAPSDALLKEFRNALFKQALGYLEARSRRRVTDVNFSDIMGMSEALEIKGYTTH